MSRISGFLHGGRSLSTDEAASRLRTYGYNGLTPEKKHGFFIQLRGVLSEPMFLLLFGTAFLYFALGEPRDGSIMVFFVVVIASISIYQEWRTDKTLSALRQLSAPKVRVIRNNELTAVDSREVVPGDLVIVEEGERIAADCKIVEMYDLGIDESMLSGEAEVVWKTLTPDTTEDGHWRRDCCYAGTTVTQGSALLEVKATGVNSEYGKIGADLAQIAPQTTPLEKQMRQLVKLCALIGVGLFIMVFIVTYMHNNSLLGGVLAGITLAMAMIPEEFPVILMIFLATGAWRLAKKNALIRRMPIVETLGSITALCVDKTGTLTMNQMTVQTTEVFDDISSMRLLEHAVLACETEPYDPMEKAILAYADTQGVNVPATFAKKLMREYPFSSESKMMAHVWEHPSGQLLTAKGSPESILPLCGFNEQESKRITAMQENMTNAGLRVIAVATAVASDFPSALTDVHLNLSGLIGLADPPRAAVPAAIQTCKHAGIRVIMITGDNGSTAQSIAAKIHMEQSDFSITGPNLETLNDGELRVQARKTNIFSRVTPRHKMRIVKALKDDGEIVAMTGDGVNDAPALKYADIGIAMGKRGTGVAREAADMILLEDDFSTIVDTIRDGRRIYDNIKKAISYVFIIHIPIALIALSTPLLHLPVLLLPIHIVLLELIIDPTCSIIFERQPAEPDIMERAPRPAKSSLVDNRQMAKAIIQGLSVFIAAFGSYFWLLKTGSSVETARTATLAILGIANLLLVHVNHSHRQYAWKALLRQRDKVTLTVNLAIIIALALIIYAPFGNVVAKTTPLSCEQLITVIVIAFSATYWWEIVKFFQRLNERGVRVNRA